MISTYKVAAVQFEPTMFERSATFPAAVISARGGTIRSASYRHSGNGNDGLLLVRQCGGDAVRRDDTGTDHEPFRSAGQRTWLLHRARHARGRSGDGPLLQHRGPDRAGRIVGKHRKSHPYISEPKWAASGDRHVVFDTKIGRIALLVCMDIHSSRPAADASAGADVICHISNWLAERTPAPYWISRAFENSCYVLKAIDGGSSGRSNSAVAAA